MADSRDPEQMPCEWHVKAFAAEKGFGTLVHDSGEEAQFTIEVWNVGSWQPTLKELAVCGDSSPLLPRAGEPVKVSWKRSRAGATVPALVQPTGRISNVKKQHTLSAWLKAMQRHAGKFAGLTPATLIKPLAKVDEDLLEEWRDREPRDPVAFAHLLSALAEEHAGWIYSDDWRWDRDRAQKTLPAMLGISSAPEPASESESLEEYVARCNRQAEAGGCRLRLFNADTTDDERVFIALEPESFEALLKGDFLITEE